MKAAICKAFGTPDDIVFEDIPEPVPAPGEVVIDISYVGLNFHETLVLSGKHMTQPQPPFSPGSEFTGSVSAIGNGVENFKIGDRVAGNNDFGAGREKMAFPAWRLCHVPAELPEHFGAALRVNYGTSYYGLKQQARLQPGETLAVLGASGGVGLAAVELGKAMGARVIACASTRERADFAVEHGADDTIVYSKEDLKEGLKRLTGGKGVDVIYDPVGGTLSEAAFRSIAIDGRHLVVGFADGEIPRIALNLPLVKSASITGVFWGAWAQRRPELMAENLAEIFAWVIEGKLNPHIQEILPFDRIGHGLNMLANREARGKILVKL